MELKKIFKKTYRRILLFLSPILGSLFIKFVGLTTRIDLVNQNYETELKKNGNKIIYTFWHNRIFLICYYYRNRGIKVLVSPSRDGEYTTKIIEQMGYETARGSSFSGGRKALSEMIEAVNQGFDAGFTPDGPRGPKYAVQPGIILLAKKTGAAILPLVYDTKKKKVFQSWDNFILPLPFNRGVFIYGPPIFVAKDLHGNEIVNIQNKLQDNLNKIVDDAEKYIKCY